MEAKRITRRIQDPRAGPDRTLGGKRQLERDGEKDAGCEGEEGAGWASLTVQVLFLGAHDLVGRGLAYCLGYRGAGDTVLGGGDSVRQALAGHRCGASAPLPLSSRRGPGPPSAGGSPPPTAPPTPTGSLPACRPGAGLRAACCRPARGEPARVPPRGLTRCRALPRPRLGSAHPLPWSAGAGQGKRDRQLQENGGARLLLGAFRAAPGSRDAGAVPPPFSRPFSRPFPPRRPPSLAQRGKSGAAPARYVMEPARRAQQEAAGRECAARRVT